MKTTSLLIRKLKFSQ